MISSILKQGAALALAFTAVAFVMPSSAMAVPVRYSTTGAFFDNGVFVGDTITVDNYTFEFIQVTNATGEATPGGQQAPSGLGLIGLTGPVPGTNTGQLGPEGITLEITINQIDPTAGTDTVVGTLMGRIDLSNGIDNAFISFGQNAEAVLPGDPAGTTIRYQLFPASGNVQLDVNDATRVGVRLVTGVVPEPAALVSSGIAVVAGLGFSLRRRMKAAA